MSYYMSVFIFVCFNIFLIVPERNATVLKVECKRLVPFPKLRLCVNLANCFRDGFQHETKMARPTMNIF